MSSINLMPWPARSSVAFNDELEVVEVRKPSSMVRLDVEHDQGWTATWNLTMADWVKVRDAVEVKRLEAEDREDQLFGGWFVFAPQWDYVEEVIHQLVETFGLPENFQVKPTPEVGRR